MPDDKIQREIEEILNRLDEFVPEERPPSRLRRRSSQMAGALGRALLRPVARISLRQVMLTSLALIVLAFFAMRIHPLFARYVIIAGVILFLTSFALSFVTRGAPPTVEKHWRGRPIELNQPSLAERLRAWLQARRRQRG